MRTADLIVGLLILGSAIAWQMLSRRRRPARVAGRGGSTSSNDGGSGDPGHTGWSGCGNDGADDCGSDSGGDCGGGGD